MNFSSRTASPTRAHRPAPWHAALRRQLGRHAGIARQLRVAAGALGLGVLLTVGPVQGSLAAGGDAPRLPSLGESAAEDFSLGTEKRLGEQIMREIRRDPDYLDDPVLLDYLQSIWQPLLKAARARGDIGPDTDTLFAWEPFLVRDRSVNAFALPGGHVGVHLGLIAMTTNAGELASVLAHEMSHVTRRHIARSIAASQRSSSVGLAAIILALIASSRAGNIEMANAAVVGGQAAMQQAQLNFSRDMEREADRNGFALLTSAGFAPTGMVSMFENLDQANRHNDNGSYPYLRSHPLTSERIGEARQRLDALLQQQAPQGSEPPSAPAATPQEPPTALTHALMRARSKVLMDSSVATLQRLQALGTAAGSAQGSSTLAERLAARYGAALAGLQLRDPAQADVHAQAAQALLAASPRTEVVTRALLALLRAEVALARGDAATAQTALAAAAQAPTRSLLLLRSQWSLANAQPEPLRAASDALQLWLADHRLDATAWQAMATLSRALGQPLRALRAEAESQAALGDLRGAIDRLRAGQQLVKRNPLAGDFIEASVIDARLRDLNAQVRALQLEAQGNGNRGEPN